MKQDEDLYCYYSGLPSPSAYQNKTEIMKGKLIKTADDCLILKRID